VEVSSLPEWRVTVLVFGACCNDEEWQGRTSRCWNRTLRNVFRLIDASTSYGEPKRAFGADEYANVAITRSSAQIRTCAYGSDRGWQAAKRASG
jgi:hypothetical protein